MYILNCSGIGEPNVEEDDKEFDDSGELGKFEEENEEEIDYEDIDVYVILTIQEEDKMMHEFDIG